MARPTIDLAGGNEPPDVGKRHGDMTERAVEDLVVDEAFWQTFE